MSKGWLTFILLLGIAVIGSNSLVLSPVLTDVAADLDTTPLVISHAIAAYGGAMALSALLLGFTIDRYSVRAVLIVGSVLLALASFGNALASSWIALSFAQGAAGLAAGVMLPAIYDAATEAGGEEEGAQLLGRVLMGWSFSLIAGVPVSAFIAERLGWQASYVALGLLVLVGLVGFGIASVGERIVDRFGPARALPFALAFVALAYASMPPTTAFQTGAFAAAFV